MTRIGVLGGSFDPIHNGHLILAEEVASELNLDKILFMPTGIQPFKQDCETASSNDRLNMLKLAIDGNNCFDITTIELDREGLSYTIDSLNMLREEYDNTEIVFILGYDMFLNIHKWYKSEELLKNFSIAVGIRKGTDCEDVNKYKESIEEEFGTNIYCVKNRVFEVSSSEIKKRVKSGDTTRYLMPDSVINYILDKKLYLK